MSARQQANISPIYSYSPETPPNNYLTPPRPDDAATEGPSARSTVTATPSGTCTSNSIPMFSQVAHDLMLDTSAGTVPCKTSNVQLAVLLDRFRFVAGQEVEGRLQLACASGSKVKLGDMTVGIIGFEGWSAIPVGHRRSVTEMCCQPSRDARWFGQTENPPSDIRVCWFGFTIKGRRFGGRR